MDCRSTILKAVALVLIGHIRKILNQKGAYMSLKWAALFRFIENYRYYRNDGYSFKASWTFASATLPS